MAPIPKNEITEHFTHIPGHGLIAVENDQEYMCDGCKTTGVGKRFRCRHGCDFDLHEYCATCPKKLSSSSIHVHHELSLVMRKQRNLCRVNRICDLCTDPVEGLFYMCKDCEFDVHPLCTQLPKQLRHALHQTHLLNLESMKDSGFCQVCKKLSSGWRYRCEACNFEIHLECVLIPVVHCQQNQAQQNAPSTPKKGVEIKQRGAPTPNCEFPWVPYMPPPQFAAYNYAHGYSYHGGAPPFNYPYGPNMHYNQHAMQPAGFAPQFHPGAAVGTVNSQGTGNPSPKPKRSMFSIVGQLGFGVLSNMVFGVDFISLFAA